MSLDHFVSRTLVNLSLLCTFLLCGGCAGTTRLLPAGGRLAATVEGTLGRLRVYTLPPSEIPSLRGVSLVYVELRNKSRRSLRVAYADLYLGRKQHVAALRPGDVLRPGRLSPGQRRLYASLSTGPLFGRGLVSPTAVRPSDLADFAIDRTAPDIVRSTERTGQNSIWLMRNDYGSGPQLTTAGWPYFGLPQPGSNLSMFDILMRTLPDGALLQGATISGFLFFPDSAEEAAREGLRWEVHDAVSDYPMETLTLPLKLSRY